MEKERISVIIILYFSKHLISDIILNVQQKIKGLGEIIFINNSGENLDEFQSENIIIIYPENNLGYGGGINLGVEKSRYEFLLVLNPDLKIERFDVSPKILKQEIVISGHNPKIPGYSLRFPTLFGSFISIALIDLLYIKAIDRIIHFRKVKEKLSEFNVDYVSGALILTNKKTFNKIGGFDKLFFLFYEETDFCKRASHLNIQVLCTTKISFIPKAGKSSSKNVDRIKIQAGIKSCKRYHTKYSGRLATMFMFYLLKLIYALYVVIIYPISFINDTLKLKKDEIVYRIGFL